MPLDAPPALPRETAQGALSFNILLALTAVLFIRPAEIFPALEGLPIFNVLILACIATAHAELLGQLSWSNLRAHPAVLCVILFLPAIVLSQVVHRNLFMAKQGGVEFSKVLIYFLLMTGLINSPARLGRFVTATLVCILGIAVVSELSFHGLLEVQGITTVPRTIGYDPDTGEPITVGQLYGPGIFNDPNDFSLVLAAAMLIIVHAGIESRSWMKRLVLLALVCVPGYAFALTNSRGGFLAFAAGIGVLGIGRFGWKRSMPALVVVLPVLLVVFGGGRMTNINLDEDDTAAGRMDIWREGLMALKATPVFGIGYGQYAPDIGHVAHNSFVHAFTELGVVGGVIFVATFFVPISVLVKRQPKAGDGAEGGPSLERWRPVLLAIMTGYAVGLCSLTRCYTMSTYLVAGMGAAYCSILKLRRPQDVPDLTPAVFRRIVFVGLGCLAFFYVVVRLVRS